ncbi:hypothetical protein HRbin36_00865 [bacterium HR36]|nr:hypothetical protein HRbin36_00865 [bacterium HR36]
MQQGREACPNALPASQPLPSDDITVGRATPLDVVNMATAPRVIPIGAGDCLQKLERLGLVLLASMLVAVLGIARWLNPYEANGRPRQYGTHEQLGLPPCAFQRSTGIPCPTCGLTTSFSLCLHGDWWAAWQANPAGPVMVSATALSSVWFLAAGLTGRRLSLPTWHWLTTLAAYGLLLLVLGSWTARLFWIFRGGL